MDKFITTNNGKMPIFLNDIRFVDGIYRNAFELLIKALEVNNQVLWGCAVTDNGNGTYSVAEGAIVINSELYICSAHTFTCTNLSEAYFVITESFDSAGLKLFGDNVSRNTYQLRRIVAGQYATQPANSIAVNATRYEFYTKAKVLAAINSAIASLIDSSPATLDTLNEIAAALGDDPNFSTTIINLLTGKVDKVTGYGLSKNDLTDALVVTIANKVDKVTGYGLSKNDLTDLLLAKLNSLPLVAEINIGAWNMDTTVGKNVSWTLPTGHHIVSVQVWIYYNGGTVQKLPLNLVDFANDTTYSVAGGFFYNGTAFELRRLTGGMYDQAVFNDGVQNRGTILVEYRPD